MLRLFAAHFQLFDCAASTYAAHPAGGGLTQN
jgi:hypothetical protein